MKLRSCVDPNEYISQRCIAIFLESRVSVLGRRCPDTRGSTVWGNRGC